MRWLLLISAFALSACPPPPPIPDGGQDAGPSSYEHCIDRPDQMGQPPNGKLPCELLPPGFKQ
ncbi:MAG: hypothetical protein QM817_21085 [Archangium sp.]